MHLPFVHLPSFYLALQIIREHRPDVVVQIGDLLDNRALSRHLKKLSERGLQHQTMSANVLFGRLETACNHAGVSRKIWTLGNHDEYMSRYVAENAPELDGYTGLQTPVELLCAEEMGWEVLPYHEPVKLGKIYAMHDVMQSGSNAAATAVAKFGHSIVFGHTHAAAVHYSGNLDGERFVSMNVGWLGDPAYAEYMPSHHKANNWTHGVGHARILENGYAWCTFVPFIDNMAVIEGKVYAV